jgi:curli production assembly/transport component CsgE
MAPKGLQILFILLLILCAVSINAQEQDTLRELPEELKSILKKYKKELASDNQENVSEQDLTVELDGLIIDETMSKIGHDFYNHFYDNWEVPGSIKDYTIYITEKPMPGMGNLITIKINHDEIFKNRISPRQDVINALADYAINQSRQYLMNYQEIKNQLEGEDMSGTGIY